MNKFSARWVVELPTVLWSLRTTPRRATSYTPFIMVYGSEAVLLIDLDYGALRIRAYDQARDIALLRLAKYQQMLRRFHSRRVRD